MYGCPYKKYLQGSMHAAPQQKEAKHGRASATYDVKPRSKEWPRVTPKGLEVARSDLGM
jgi:hypothetical protein